MKTDFEIEKDVPIPSVKGPDGRYPWREMEVGDSFFVKVSPGGDVEVKQKALASSAAWQKRRRGRRFTVRQVEGGVRVWRIE